MAKKKRVSSKKPVSKKSALARRQSKAQKIAWAKAREIKRREPELTWNEARGRISETFIETIRHSGRKAAKRWLLMSGEDVPMRDWKYREIRPGRPAEYRYTMGPFKSYGQVQRSQGAYQYWGLVQRISRMFNLSIQKSRDLLKRAQEEMTTAARGAGIMKQFRVRDAAAMLEYSDRYPKLRREFGI